MLLNATVKTHLIEARTVFSAIFVLFSGRLLCFIISRKDHVLVDSLEYLKLQFILRAFTHKTIQDSQ